LGVSFARVSPTTAESIVGKKPTSAASANCGVDAGHLEAPALRSVAGPIQLAGRRRCGWRRSTPMRA
jgi:hypothetical protein